MYIFLGHEASYQMNNQRKSNGCGPIMDKWISRYDAHWPSSGWHRVKLWNSLPYWGRLQGVGASKLLRDWRVKRLQNDVGASTAVGDTATVG